MRKVQTRYIEYYVSCTLEYTDAQIQWQDSPEQILHVLKLCREYRDHQNYCKLASNIAQVLIDNSAWGEYIDIIPFCLELDDLHISEEIAILETLADIYQARGLYEQANDALVRRLHILKDADIVRQEDEFGKTFAKLAELSKSLGKYVQACDFLRQQLSITHTPRLKVDIIIELVEILLRIKEYEDAIQSCEHGLQIAQDISYVTATIDLVSYIGDVWRIRSDSNTYEDINSSLTYYNHSLELAHSIGDQNRIFGTQEKINMTKSIMNHLQKRLGQQIFICYSHQDSTMAERIAEDLSVKGFTVWWDEWEIKVGDSIIQEVSQGIHDSEFLIAVISEKSVQSHWVQTELNSAMMKQIAKRNGFRILPALIEDCELPTLLVDKKFADFRASYIDGLNQILNAIA